MKTVKTTGLLSTKFIGTYNFNGKLINGRPFYVKGQHGIWCNGHGWMIGYLSDVGRGKVTSGYIKTNEDTACPTSTVIWKERWSE